MEVWYLAEGSRILDRIHASSREEADQYFINEGWMIGDVLSEGDYLAELQLNQLENQSSEC